MRVMKKLMMVLLLSFISIGAVYGGVDDITVRWDPVIAEVTTQSGVVRYKVYARLEGQEFDMRVSTFPAMYGNKIVMRLLEKSAKPKTLEQLGYADQPLETMYKNLDRTYGFGGL